MRLLWSRKRIRAYVYAAGVLLAVLVSEIAFVMVHSTSVRAAGHTAGARHEASDSRRLPTIAGTSDESHIDPVLSRVATKLGRRRAEVRCWSTADWEVLAAQLDDSGDDLTAYMSSNDRRVHLPWHTCPWLHAASQASTSLNLRAAALAAFAHEIEHLRGVADETRAECYSYQHLALAAEALRAPQTEARRLARFAWEEFYPPQDPGYSSPECHNGGLLDLRPASRVWP
jgi:hypothetical protein